MIETIAKICHEANRAYCEDMGDFSHVSWEASESWVRSSMRDGVVFHLENPEASPAASHEHWLRGKQAEGWVYGEEKDVASKTHPCMVPFSQLGTEQQAKDHLVKAIVGALRHQTLQPIAKAEVPDAAHA